MTVYVDVLLLVNFVINLVLLKTSAYMAGRSFFLSKASLGAFLGSLGALTVFMPAFSFFTMLSYKLLFAAVMVFVSFGYEDPLTFLKDFICLLSCTFIFSGLIIFIYLAFSPGKLVIANGSFYFDVSAVFLLSTAFAAYVFISVLNFFFARKKPAEEICILKIRQGEREATLRGLIDTGSSLYEPFSNFPVIVCNKSFFEGEVEEEKALINNVRIVPFETIGGRGILKAFLADSVKIELSGKEVEVKKGCYIALSDENFRRGFYDAIVNPAVLER